jgi:hypothetical protein
MEETKARTSAIRIWDVKTNQAVGDPLLHDDQLLAVAISRDGKSIASAGLDKKNYVWNLEAALKNFLVGMRFVVQFPFLTVLAIQAADAKLKATLLCFSFTLHLTFH